MTTELNWQPVSRPIKVIMTTVSKDYMAKSMTYEYDVLAFAIRDRNLLYMTAQGWYIDIEWYRQQEDRYIKVVVP